MTEPAGKGNPPLPRPPGMSKKQLSPLQRVLVEQQQDKNMGGDSRNNQKENTLTMPLIQQQSTIAKRQLLNSLSETKVRPGKNWLSESMDIHGKPVDLGATHSHFLKT